MSFSFSLESIQSHLLHLFTKWFCLLNGFAHFTSQVVRRANKSLIHNPEIKKKKKEKRENEKSEIKEKKKKIEKKLKVKMFYSCLTDNYSFSRFLAMKSAVHLLRFMNDYLALMEEKLLEKLQVNFAT